MKTKILITVVSGIIQSISTNTNEVEISVADFDRDDSSVFQYYKSNGDSLLSDEVIEGQIRQSEEDFSFDTLNQ